MHRKNLVTALACVVGWLAFVQPAAANPTLRKQVDQRGDFVLIGNTLAHECGNIGDPPVPAPVVGTIGNCPEINLTAPDVFFRSDDPSAGAVRADSSITAEQARTTAVLNLPANATVTYARLYWGSYAASSMPNGTARIERESSGVNMALNADMVWPRAESPGNTGRFWYQATAEVTEIVRAQASGPYRVSDVSALALDQLQGDPYGYDAWYMVVFYELDTEPQRNLGLFEGLDLVEPGAPATVNLQGFLVPSSGFDAKLGIVTFEGDATIDGDRVSWDGTDLSDALNPVNNFFNSTRSALGKAVSVPGDLPQLTGQPRSMSGIDLDVLDLTMLVKPGQTSATINSSTTLDTYLFAAWVTSVSTLKPNFQNATKSVKTVGRDSPRPGDELEYTIEFTNDGSDDSTATVVRDALPMGVTFVPGSLEIVSGPAAGKKTDAVGDDEAEYDSASRTIRVRVGTGANATTGGSLAVGDKVTLRFHVKIDDATRGKISNQGFVNAAGKKGATAEDTPTDGDPVKPDAQSTDTTVNVCDTDADCKPPTPLCDISSEPQGCVECVTSADCKDPGKPDCSSMTHTCGCFAGAGKTCDKDTDGDGVSDDGENMTGTNPNDWDTDDDGTPDGAEFTPELDPDGDGLPNGLDADSDNDGLYDGTEQGFDCSNPATDKTLGRCRADEDKAGTTNPVKADTDRGKVTDGSEDFNLNGKVDPTETDPVFGKGADDKAVDLDGDGVSDGLEKTLHSDPNDADSDDDGVPDGEEANPSEDTDLDLLVNVLDVDSDDDALYDGTELGRDCSAKGTDLAKKHCRADADSGKTKTSPLLKDTDKGGARDGSEDSNLDGRVDTGERDPTKGHEADDGMVVDTDGDGLSDGTEKTLGSDPSDKDSDDDGVPDGEEPNPGDDHDGDGKINILDPDSDGDGLFDGTELGKSCSDAAVDASKMQCIADADPNTHTGSLTVDTDRGSVSDGVEDRDHNGRLDPAELDPLDPDDDVIGKPCSTDMDCGGPMSGLVCNNGMCDFGCRGMGGNTCPNGLFCSSTSNMVGECTDMMPVVDAGMPVIDAGPMLAPGGKLGGAGCDCRVARLGSQPTAAGIACFAVFSLLLVARVRRRRGR